jgi:hypothetical protein
MIMTGKKLDDWVVVCKNRECRQRYSIPQDWPMKWKLKKFRGVVAVEMTLFCQNL